MEKVLDKSSTIRNEKVWAMTKVILLSIGFATAYVAMTVFSPIPANSETIGLFFGKVIRVANVLRAFMLITPAALAGTMLGSLWLNKSEGLVGVTKWSVALAVGLFFYWLMKKVGRGHVKDVVLMGAYGACTSLAMATIPALIFWKLTGGLPPEFESVMWFRAVSTALIYALGAYCVMGYEWGYKQWRNRGESLNTK